MNEQLVTELIEAMKAQTSSQIKQTEAINRLASSNESLCKLIMQTLAEDIEEEIIPQQTYLSGKAVR
ncbi:hypothetical protein I7V28_01600 [Lelliottia amnigena]|uniref:hypothetical protein n=1 Tax=Lelliottia amnigena TaxID=61646 RepID=UPI00192C56BA|nr:hypothetical protein [Lelliottia amnigena]MBL5919829.1 hypothetical protein [Lelliottia amnigena]